MPAPAAIGVARLKGARYDSLYRMSRTVLLLFALLLPVACSEPEPRWSAKEPSELPPVASQTTSDCEPESTPAFTPPQEFIPPIWEGLPLPREKPTRVAEPVEPFVPEYTEAARKARIEGVVIIAAGIAKDGTVVGSYVLKGLPFCLDAKALEAVERAEFRPALVGDRPIDSVVNLTVQFQLDE
jgi:TonB family protein